MSDSSNRGYLDGLAILLVIFILVTFSCLAVAHSSIGKSYSRDLTNEETYCAAQYKGSVNHESANCQSFWYRTFSDPSIAWNFYYSCLTMLLVVAAGVTVTVAIRSARIQVFEARRLFCSDQRPWLRVNVEFRQPVFKPNSKGDIQAFFNIFIENKGKTPAVNVANVHVRYHVCDVIVRTDEEVANGAAVLAKNSEPFIPARDKTRKSAKHSSCTDFVYPDQSVTHIASVFLQKKDVDATWATGHLCHIKIYCAVAYESALEKGKKLETVMVYNVNAGALYTHAIPRNEEEIEFLRQMLPIAESIGGVPDLWTAPFLWLDGEQCVIT